MMAYKVTFVRDLPEWLTLIRQVVLKHLFLREYVPGVTVV